MPWQQVLRLLLLQMGRKQEVGGLLLTEAAREGLRCRLGGGNPLLLRVRRL